MPRYNITLSASNEQCPPITGRVWAPDANAAEAAAISKLALLRATRRFYRHLDEWELWQGVPPYTPHATVARGQMAARS